MNKAKALFALGIIVVVAATTGALLMLNENGKLGNSQSETTTVQQTEYNTVQTTTEAQTTEIAEETTLFSDDEINSFLTVFSNVYFAEQKGSFSAKAADPYDLLLFAFLHTRNTDKAAITTKQADDAIGWYSCISIEKVNNVLDEYFGLVVDAESVFTENDYDFFRYENGYFMTPAADGLAYRNYCVSDSVVRSGDSIIVQFTVYSGNDKYASGEARIKTSENGMRLDLYKVRF